MRTTQIIDKASSSSSNEHSVSSIPALINELGKSYLAKYTKSPAKLWHSNQPIAELCLRYAPLATASLTDHENFLLGCYMQLPDLKGKLARSMQSFFSTYFDKEITQESMLNIPDQAIQLAGQLYLTKYPTSKRYFFYPHTNQIQAKKLTEYQGLSVGNTSLVSRWGFLIDIYSSLSDCEGTLAKTLEHLLNHAFQIYFTTHTAEGEHIRKFSTQEIVVTKLLKPMNEVLALTTVHIPMQTLNKTTSRQPAC
jgi:hypothetical protein